MTHTMIMTRMTSDYEPLCFDVIWQIFKFMLLVFARRCRFLGPVFNVFNSLGKRPIQGLGQEESQEPHHYRQGTEQYSRQPRNVPGLKHDQIASYATLINHFPLSKTFAKLSS